MFTAVEAGKIIDGLTCLLNTTKENEQDSCRTVLFVDESDFTFRDELYFRVIESGEYESAFALPRTLYREAFPVLDFCHRNDIRVIFFTTRVSKDRVVDTAEDIMKKYKFESLIDVILLRDDDGHMDSLSKHLHETDIPQNKKNNAYLFSRFNKTATDFEESNISSNYFKRIFTLCLSDSS